jgi:phosphoribosyl-ATP pyrophosphohydrolase
MPSEIDRLFAAVLAARAGDPSSSKTAKLLADGPAKMAKKVAEEAVEVALDAVRGDRRRVIEESADLLYNLTVLWAELGVTPSDVWDEIAWRERTFGIAEKLPKDLARREDI